MRYLILLLALALTGCVGAVVSGRSADLVLADVKAAVHIAEASAPILGPRDQLAPCLRAIANGLEALRAGAGAKVDGFNGVVTEAVRLYVVDAALVHLSPDFQRVCGPIALRLMLNTSRRWPGL